MIKKIKGKIQDRKFKKAREREQKAINPSAYDNAVIGWIAPEYLRLERGIFTKLFYALVLATTAVFGILYDSWTFSLAILVFAFVYYIIHLEHPKNVEVKISNIGIKAGNRQYPYGRIKGFWIVYEPPYLQTLNIRVEGDILYDITIQLNGQDPAEVREYLLSKIPEFEGKGESPLDALLRFFKI